MAACNSWIHEQGMDGEGSEQRWRGRCAQRWTSEWAHWEEMDEGVCEEMERRMSAGMDEGQTHEEGMGGRA